MSGQRVRMAFPPSAGDPSKFGQVVRMAEGNGWNIVLADDDGRVHRALLAHGGEVVHYEQRYVMPDGTPVERVTDPRNGVTTFAAPMGDRPAGRPAEVTVYGPDEWSQDRPYEVNWSAMGSKPPEAARVYGALLSFAAGWATEQEARRSAE